jgi:integrase
MKVSFYPDRSKSSNTVRTIWANIYEDRNKLLLNTHEKVDTKYWDKKTHRANIRKAKDPRLKGELNLLNRFLSSYEGKIHSIRLKMKTENPSIEFSEIENQIKIEFGKKSNTFYDIYNQFIIAKGAIVGKETIQKHKRLKTILGDFEKDTGYKVNFNSINKLFEDKFFSYLIEDKEMLNSTAHKTISFLKTFLIWAYDRKLNPNRDFRSFKGKTYENEVIFLTEEELMTLYNFKLDDDRLARVRDVFVFQCFTGPRYSDILSLKKEDIRAGTWNLRQQKTRNITQIPLNKYAISILAKYPDNKLPVISNQKMNNYIKELCELAGIDETITIVKYRGNKRIEETKKKFEIIGTHTARRTFITLSLRKGMKPEVIMKITGHKSYKMFQKYLKIADDHTRKEMFEAWGEPLNQVNI